MHFPRSAHRPDYRRCKGFSLTIGFALLFAGRALAQTPEEHKTLVVPLPDEEILNPCEYRLLLPGSTDQVRAVWVIFDRGQDYLRWYQDRQVQAFSRTHRLALVLAMHCRSKEREDMIVEPTKGVGRALFTALDQFAASEHREDLAAAPIVAMGWSGAGSLVGRLAGYRSERYLAGIAYAPGQYEPLGMDTIDLSADAIRKPELIIANGGDNINGTKRPYDYFRRYFEKGAPWTFAVQNRTPHCCLANAQTLILDWLHGVLVTPPESWGKGTHGYISVEFSPVVDEWKNRVFNATAARVSEKNRGAKSGELPCGWLPAGNAAGSWLSFVRRADPIAIWKP
jgi:hypothetical protein